MVAVVVAVIDAEGSKTPPLIVPADAGLTVHVTVWLGLSGPATCAVNVVVLGTVSVAVVGVTPTEVTVVDPPPPMLPEVLPQAIMPVASANVVKATPSKDSLDAMDVDAASVLLRIAVSPFQRVKGCGFPQAKACEGVGISDDNCDLYRGR
jgi:hypothetical protein